MTKGASTRSSPSARGEVSEAGRLQAEEEQQGAAAQVIPEEEEEDLLEDLLEVELSTATAAYEATAASFILGVLEFARLALAAELATELATGLATGRFVMGAGASEGAAVATETALSTTIGGSAGDGCCCCCGGGSVPGFCGAACDASGCEEFGGGTANRTAGSRRRIQTRTELPVRMYTPHGQSSVGRQG